MRQMPAAAIRTLVDIKINVLLNADPIGSLLGLRTRLIHDLEEDAQRFGVK